MYPKRFDEDEVKDIVRFYLEGWSTPQLASQFDVSVSTVCNYLQEAGVERKQNINGNRHPKWGGGKTTEGGYISLWVDDDDPLASMMNSKGRIREHRYIMAQSLGRVLTPDETVHHINGDRTDNRIENLELWSSSQPPGQRVEDKLAWAREIQTKYAPNYEAEEETLG